MYIQTVYLPVENINYIEDWLKYHTAIGIEHFFLYDNSGAEIEPYSRGLSIKSDNKNKHGFGFNKDNHDAVIQKEKEIFSKYPVTKIKWTPIVDGKIAYNQLEAAMHFAKYMKKGLCAFIDIDEFLVPGPSGFMEGRMQQKRMKSRFYFDKITDCNDVFNIQHKDWSPKLIMDLSRLNGWRGRWPETIHFYTDDFFKLPYIDTYFNHYSHSERHHSIMLPDVISFIQNNLGDTAFCPKIEDFDKSFHYEDQSHIFKEILL